MHVAGLRQANSNDIDTLVGLVNRAFVVEQFFLVRERASADDLREALKRGVFLLAESCGAVEGAIYCEIKGGAGRIGMLSVEPALQGRGLGRRLMNAAEEYFRGHGCTRVELRVVDHRVELPAFYSKMGFARTGIEPFPEDIEVRMPCRLVVMQKNL